MSEHLTQTRRRRTFAIISHPDAGKTTLTEKLLLFGGAIQMAGSVKGRKAARHATSDWMALEKERGISVTSSVMQFPYEGRIVNLLDTHTTPLLATLERLVDFDRINDDRTVRLTVGVTDVESGNFRYFDSRDTRIGPKHILASGSLPPAFAPVEIEGRHYWDGGVVSNTPLEHILDEWPREDTLAFQVDLWSARGQRPQTMMDVLERGKDIQYSSRTRHGTDTVARTQQLRTALNDLIARLPEGGLPESAREALAPWLDDRVINIVHLIYQAKPHEQQFKDYAFGRISMESHWQSGLADTRQTLSHPGWFDLPDRDHGYAVHDVHRVTQKKHLTRF